MTKKEICHVCGKVKKPYTLFVTNNICSMIQHAVARRDGPICERCDRYHAMTGELKEPTEEEMTNAVEAAKFANMVQKWWTKDKALSLSEDNDVHDQRSWPGTCMLAQWHRENANKKNKVVK